MSVERDEHCGPVPKAAREADRFARQTRGRVEIFNATRPDGMDHWTMDETQHEVIRGHILAALDGKPTSTGASP